MSFSQEKILKRSQKAIPCPAVSIAKKSFQDKHLGSDIFILKVFFHNLQKELDKSVSLYLLFLRFESYLV